MKERIQRRRNAFYKDIIRYDASDAEIDQSDHFLLRLVHLIEFFKHRCSLLYSPARTAAI